MNGTSQTTGASRLERVLDPTFLLDIEELPVGEIRRRRDEALAEREFQSYLRRLVQVRHDLLQAERVRRMSDQEPRPLVERLTAVLSDGPKGAGRGEALRDRLTTDDIAEAERRVERALDGVDVSAAETLDQEQLQRSIAALEEEERGISGVRVSVIKVHDRLQDELKVRYRENPSLALQGY